MRITEWENDTNWRVRISKDKIYIMRDHNWAFAAWEIERNESTLRAKSLLVHVDAHLDNVVDGIRVNGLFEAKTNEEIIAVAQSCERNKTIPSNLMHIDNFIWASLGRGTIEEVIYVSYDDKYSVTTLEELNRDRRAEAHLVLESLPVDCNYRHLRFNDIETFISRFDSVAFKEYVGDRTVILDLDIDYFNIDGTLRYPNIMPLHMIRERVNALMNLYKWDVITIAISPDYCGGAFEADLMLETVMKEMGIDAERLEHW